MLLSKRACLKLLLALAGQVTAINVARQANVSDPLPPVGTNSTDEVAPKRFILEFHPDTNVQTASAQIASLSGSTIVKTFDNELFRGVAVETIHDNTDSLQSLDVVSQAWPARRYALAPVTKNDIIGGGDDSQFGNYSVHQMTGVDKLHDQGLFGKGAHVAIVDTGVDYTHPALGGGFGPGFKVAGGYDFVGDGTWPNPGQQLAPDNDPKDNQGHGTHVSGIIAGKADNFMGVAPEATLYMYKVFSTIDGTDEDVIIEAFLRAYDEGADIITSSIGGVSGWTDGPWALVASRMVDQGVLVTISAGNDGNAGPFAASSGSSGYNALAIASVEADRIALPTFKGFFMTKNSTTTNDIPFRTTYPFDPEDLEGFPIVTITNDSIVSDACAPITAKLGDLSNKIVLVRRGNCSFQQKQDNLDQFNITNVLVQNNDSPLVAPGSINPFSELAMISNTDGQRIADTIRAGGKVTVSFKNQSFVGFDNADSPGAPSAYTSIGPTNELFLKSDVAAPGGQIWSTYLNHGFASLSGTSMACPYVAGVAALYVGKYGGRSTHGVQWAKTLAMKIITSGEALKWDDGQGTGAKYDFLASVAQVGSGLINATKVMSVQTELSLTRFALNDTANLNRLQEISITNPSQQKVVYTFSQQEYGAMDSVNLDPSAFGAPKIAWAEETLIHPFEMAPKMTCPEKVTVDPGATRKALCTFTNPVAANPLTMPIYSGKTIITGTNGDVMGVPYLGLAADLRKDIKIMFEYPIGFPTIQSGVNNTPIANKTSFSFNFATNAQDFPRAYIRLQYATRELRWDIFNANYTEKQWSYPPKVGQNGFVGSTTSWSGAGSVQVFDPAVQDPTDLIALPRRDMPRDIPGLRGTDLWWLGRLADGSTIKPGQYKMRLAALRPFGNGNKSIDWDIFQTPVFTVVK